MRRAQRSPAAFADGLSPLLSTTDSVRAAMENAAADKRPARNKFFQFDQLSPREKTVVPLLGIYLGFSVARLHERFPVLQVPYLLWTLMAIMLLTLMAAVPRGGWRTVWDRSPQLRLVALLGVLAIITVPMGIWMSGSLDYLINRFTIAIAVFIASLFLFRDPKAFRRVIVIYVACTSVIATMNVIGYFKHDYSLTLMTDEDRQRFEETGEINPELLRQSFGSLDPNDIAAVAATTFPLALWLAIGSFRRRMIWTPAALILIVAVIPTASRGGLLGLAAAAIVLTLVGARGGKRVFLIMSLAAGAAAFMILAGDKMNRMDDLGSGDYNYTASEGRIAIWKRGIVWMIKRPWGYGLNNFPTYFSWLNGPERAAHNSLIQYGVELGVIGLGAYLLIAGSLVKSLLKIRSGAMRGGPKEQELVTLTGHVLAMLAACWTTGFFLSNAYYPLTYMAIGIGSAVVLSRVEATSSTAVAAPAAVPARVGRARRRNLRAFNTA